MPDRRALCADCERDILRVNPWEMDDTPYRVLDNRMVWTRYSHECAVCLGAIDPLSRVRAQRETYDNKARTFYFCVECCDAMRAFSAGIDRDGSRLAHRYDIGRGAANASRV